MLLQMARFHSFCSRVIFHCSCVPQFFSHWPIDRHLGCSPSLAIVNIAAMNIRAHLSFQISVLGFYGDAPRSRVTGSKVDLFLIFLGNCILCSTVAAPICIPNNSAKRSPFSTASPALVCWFIGDGHSDGCEGISRGFDLHFLDD